jgi:hypothetical protein
VGCHIILAQFGRRRSPFAFILAAFECHDQLGNALVRIGPGLLAEEDSCRDRQSQNRHAQQDQGDVIPSHKKTPDASRSGANYFAPCRGVAFQALSLQIGQVVCAGCEHHVTPVKHEDGIPGNVVRTCPQTWGFAGK